MDTCKNGHTMTPENTLYYPTQEGPSEIVLNGLEDEYEALMHKLVGLHDPEISEISLETAADELSDAVYAYLFPADDDEDQEAFNARMDRLMVARALYENVRQYLWEQEQEQST